MPSKKNEDSLPQTDINFELDESITEDISEASANAPQTDLELTKESPPSPEDGVELSISDPIPHTDSANTVTGDEKGTEGDTSYQTDSENISGVEIRKAPKRVRRKTAEKNENPQIDTETESEIRDTEAEEHNALKTRRQRNRSDRNVPVMSIDAQRTVETEADKLRNDLLDLVESQKTGKILTGTIQGVETSEDNQNHSFAVIYHGEYKIIIPVSEAVEPPEDYRGLEPDAVLRYMVTKRLGAEVDYIVKGIDAKENVAIASRLDAMRAKRKAYYFGTDRDGNNMIYSGICAEARVVSAIRTGIFADIFGLEVYIPLSELSYQRWMDAAAHFQPGQRILVKILEVERKSRNEISVSASVKQAGENPYEKALRRYTVGNRYVGTVSMVDINGVFVALDGGIDCLCSYPKRGRPPRGARVTVRILGINYNTNRIWGAITHIATPR